MDSNMIDLRAAPASRPGTRRLAEGVVAGYIRELARGSRRGTATQSAAAGFGTRQSVCVPRRQHTRALRPRHAVSAVR